MTTQADAALAGQAPTAAILPYLAAGRRVASSLPDGAAPCRVLIGAAARLRRDVRVLPLETVPTAPGRARRWLRVALDDWRLARLSSVAELLVSELATNAVRHACGPVRLRAALCGGTRGRQVLRVEVFDGDRDLPAPQQQSADAESGRGLLLVQELAQRWGCRRARHGKLIWFELDLDA